MLGEGGEEVRVDVGEEDEADAFDGDDNVTVFAHSLHGACVALIDSAGDSYSLPGGVVGLGVYFASFGGVGCE